LHVRPLGFTDFIASAGTAQWGQVTSPSPSGEGSSCPSGASSSRKQRQASFRTIYRTEEKEKQVVEKVLAI
ncbi:hypothetical protein VDR71_10645, partial [Xanthomonas campestris pv. campestris]|nr:hypothetical protein [Xanthomonas campestris pv. campestris]MEB1925778.1 hypothetical protein [Xanthomonas campestris pv. campestris]